MALPNVITLEISPRKSTLSFEVLEPSKIVIESQPNASYSTTPPLRTMSLSTEPVDDATVPSLVGDATYSRIPSENSLRIDSEDGETHFSGRSRHYGDDSGTKSVQASHRGHTSHSHTGSSEHGFHLSISTLASRNDDDANVVASTTSESDLAIKKSTVFTTRESKGYKGRTVRKRGIARRKNNESPPTSSSDASATETTDKPHHAGSRWAESEDALLRSMKEGGETWATIATALGRGKKDVQLRFKEFKTSKEGRGRMSESSRKPATRAGVRAWSSKNSSKRCSRDHHKPTPHFSRNSWVGYMSDSPDPESVDSEAQQQIYLQDQIRENLYPPYLSLKDDDHFTKRDCEVLATVDSKMKRGKWLEMQANFFNVTGKMVPVSVFRDKCGAAEAEERERIREAKIESWKAGLDFTVQYDPNEPFQIA